MKKIILLLPLLVSFTMMAQTTLTINSVSVAEVDPVTRGGKFNLEIKYKSSAPMNANLQFWMAYFKNKEYDAWFINKTIDAIQVLEGEENKEKIANIVIDFPSQKVVENYKPNGFGKHKKFKIKRTSKLKKGEEYQLRIFVPEGIKIVDASSLDTNTNTNIKRTFVQKGKSSCFFAVPNIASIK